MDTFCQMKLHLFLQTFSISAGFGEQTIWFHSSYSLRHPSANWMLHLPTENTKYLITVDWYTKYADNQTFENNRKLKFVKKDFPQQVVWCKN